MFYAGEVPWHELGTPVEDAVTAEEAIELAGLNWEVKLGQLYGGPTLRKAKRIEDRLCTYRDSDMKVLGIVSNSYRTFQNREAFSFLDSLVQDGVLRYETAGSLFGGQRIFLLAQLEQDMRVDGDSYVPYLLLTTGHDGMSPIRIQPTSVRVVCNNTLQSALATGERVRIVHNPGLATNLESAREILKVSTESMRKLQAFLERAREVEVSEDELEGVTNELFGPLDDATPTRRAHAIRTFQEIYAAETAAVGENAYALVNAVTGYADHARSYHAGKGSAEKRFLSLTDTWGSGYQFKLQGIELVKGLV